MRTYLIISLIITFHQIINSCEGSHSKCYECVNICCDADEGKAKEFSVYFNETCKTNCRKFPFQANDHSISPTVCSRPDEKCFTAYGIMKYKVNFDNTIFTVNYVQRGCTQSCPVDVCDFTKLSECKFSPELTKYLENRINSEKNKLIKKIHETFGGEENVTNLGMGGEIKCCTGEGCNTVGETEVAHTYIKDEL